MRWSDHSKSTRHFTRLAVSPLRALSVMLALGGAMGHYQYDGPGYWTVFLGLFALRSAITGLDVYNTPEDM